MSFEREKLIWPHKHAALINATTIIVCTSDISTHTNTYIHTEIKNICLYCMCVCTAYRRICLLIERKNVMAWKYCNVCVKKLPKSCCCWGTESAKLNYEWGGFCGGLWVSWQQQQQQSEGAAHVAMAKN